MSNSSPGPRELLRDLLYFAPRLGVRKGSALLVAKLVKRHNKRRAAAALRGHETGEALLRRLGLPVDAQELAEHLRSLMQNASPPRRTSPEPPRQVQLQADEVLEGTQRLFGQKLKVGWLPNWSWRWNQMPQEQEFQKDIRSTWEVQRLQGLLPLALASSTLPENRERYAAAYIEAILDFQQRHPAPQGPAWASALEVGLRLVSLVQGLSLVSPTAAFEAQAIELLSMLDTHARWLAADLSLDKVVRGNHLLGELAGLTAVGHLIPSAQDQWWLRDVQTDLEQEILTQFHTDGVNVEQSLTYQKFILEFLCVAAHIAELRRRPFANSVLERLHASASHLSQCTSPQGIPTVGDADFGRGAWWGTDPGLDTTETAAQVEAVSGLARTEQKDLALFTQGGHGVMAAPDQGFWLFVRSGPFGWTERGPASHSHCDCLSPVVFIAGEPLLVDPGVYGYNVSGGWRDSFRDWKAHNTVDLPGQDPQSAGTFRWRRLPPGGHLRNPDSEALSLEGEVALRRQNQLLIWQRLFSYNQLDESLEIRDRFPKANPELAGQDLVWSFHLPAETSVELSEGGATIQLPRGIRVEMTCEPLGRLRVDDGWVAPSYGRRVAAPVLRRVLTGPVDSTVRFRQART